jgi:prophage regulatory protein
MTERKVLTGAAATASDNVQDSAMYEFASTPSHLAHPGDSGSTSPPRPIRLLRLRQVTELVGLRRAAIYNLQREGRFPLRVKLGVRAVGWVEAEVQEWLARRIQERHPPSPVTSKSRSRTPSDDD